MAVDSTDHVKRFGTSLLSTQTSSRSKRKSDHPSRLPLFTYCRNAACQAKLVVNYIFCKRCSCYICYGCDENKMPSFWLVCESDTQLQKKPCGLSCHLECALKVEGLINMDNNSGTHLDGSLRCRNYGSVNDLISCCRKLLMEAEDVWRVSDLCSRVHLTHMILNSSEKYRNLHEIVDSLKNKLELDKLELELKVRALDSLSISMSRSLVPHLTFGDEAQRLYSRAIDFLDSISLTSSQFNCIESPNCEVGVTNENSLERDVNVQGLEVKEDKAESKDTLLIDLNEFPESHIDDTVDGELKTRGNEIVTVPISTHDLVMEDCSKCSKGWNEIKIGCKDNANGYSDMKYWLSMRATPKSTMQVSVFLDTFADDPNSLVEQLVHTFGEEVRAA